MIQDSGFSVTSRAGDGDDDEDQGDPHQGHAASAGTARMVFYRLFDIHFFIVLMMMVKGEVSQLIVYQTIVLPLHTLHLTCLS